MATTKLVVSCMYSGQGMCNVIEAYDGTDVTKLMLVDFGAEKDSATAREFTLESLKAKIIKHKKIDVLITSHSDKDHWNLMGELLDELPDSLPIDIAVFGIGTWVKAAETFKEKVVARVPTKAGLKLFDAAFSNIAADGSKISVYPLGWEGVQFNILAASVQIWNIDSNYAKEYTEPNTASVVLRARFGTNYSVLTGDATGTTLKYMNSRMGDRIFPNDCLMMTAPHHGALATLYGTLSDLEKFVEKCEPENALASAQMRGGFNHPAVCVIAAMADSGGTGSYGSHSMVLSFFDTSLCTDNTIYKELNALTKTQARPDSRWYEVSSNRNIYTTLLTGSTGINWNFNALANGSTSVTSSALAVDFVRGVIVPHVPGQRTDQSDVFYVGMPPSAAFLEEVAPEEAEAARPPRQRRRTGPFAVDLEEGE